MKGGFIQYNGKFYRENEQLFASTDLFRLGIGLCETFRAESNEILFAESVYQHLADAADSINLKLPKDYDPNGLQLKRDVSRLLNKNKLYLSAQIVLQLFPGPNGSDIILSAVELPREFFPINENGLLLDIYTESKKPKNSICNYEPGGRFLWMMAANAASKLDKQNMFLLNNDGNICEAISCSFGIIKNNLAIFPSAQSGGYQSSIIKQVVKCTKKCGFQIIHKSDITVDELLDADEIFLIDNCLGIQKVLGIRHRRFYSGKTVSIAAKLMEMAAADRASKH